MGLLPPAQRSLPGGWPAFPGWGFHPLELTTLPGRTEQSFRRVERKFREIRLATIKDRKTANVRNQYWTLFSLSLILNDFCNPHKLKDVFEANTQRVYPLAHAHRHGADKWTRKQRRAFANDFDNLLVVDDSANQSKSDQAPHEWLPPNKGYWCDYDKRWERVQDKYGLRLQWPGTHRIKPACWNLSLVVLENIHPCIGSLTIWHIGTKSTTKSHSRHSKLTLRYVNSF